MITQESVARSLSQARSALLGRSSTVAQGILALFLLMVVLIAALKPFSCETIDARFEAKPPIALRTPTAFHTEAEEPVLEEGPTLSTPTHHDALIWRWREGQGSSPPPPLGLSPSFVPREVEAEARAFGMTFSHVLAIARGVAYIAYFPEEHGIGVVVYALDLEHNSPLWRTTVREVDARGTQRTEVQLHVASDSLHVMSKEGELRRIDELDLSSGEILSMSEIERELTERLAPPEALTSWHRHCVFKGHVLKPSCASFDDQSASLNASLRAIPLQVVRQSEAGQTLWRLRLIGDRLSFVDLSELYPEALSDVILSDRFDAPGSVLTALDHATGRVLWTTSLDLHASQRPAAELEPTLKRITTDVALIADLPTLVIHGEDQGGAYTVYMDPQSGELWSLLRD